MIAAAGIAALAGAVSGATINTKPLARGIDAWQHVPRAEFAARELERETYRTDLPDHYPLITPQGRIEVAELRDHGLYRNRRYGLSGGWYEPAEEPAYHVVEADYRYVPDDFARDAPPPPPPAWGQRDRPVALAAAAEPLSLEQPVELAVQPRVIDVSAELAARR